MSPLIELRSYPHLAPWAVAACPYAYSEAARAQFSSMPGIAWSPDPLAPNGRGYWVGPREAIAIVLRTLEAAKIAKVQGLSLERPPLARAFASDGSGLRSYQAAGIGWLLDTLALSGAALLADDMGLGKTAQAIVAADVLGARSIRVICPAIMRRKWAKEFKRWGSPLQAPEILSYEGHRSALKKGEAAPAELLILDEAHYCSNPKSLRTVAVRAWLDGQPNRPMIIALTGTPMADRPVDLFSLLDLLHPGRWGRRDPRSGRCWSFEARYCDGHKEEIPVRDETGSKKRVWVATGVSRPGELAERLTAVMLRRIKAEVAQDLPTLTREVIELELPASARKAMDRARRATSLDKQSLQGLLSACEEHKLDAAVELAQQLVGSGRKPLILTTRKATTHALAVALKDLEPARVDGDTPPAERPAALEGARVGIATIYSITTGIDLVSFDSVIMVGLDWMPWTLLQAEARIHRIGQQNACMIYYLVALATLDEVVRDRVIEKLDSFAAIVGGSDESELSATLKGGSEDQLLTALAAAAGKAT